MSHWAPRKYCGHCHAPICPTCGKFEDRGRRWFEPTVVPNVWPDEATTAPNITVWGADGTGTTEIRRCDDCDCLVRGGT